MANISPGIGQPNLAHSVEMRLLRQWCLTVQKLHHVIRVRCRYRRRCDQWQITIEGAHIHMYTDNIRTFNTNNNKLRITHHMSVNTYTCIYIKFATTTKKTDWEKNWEAKEIKKTRRRDTWISTKLRNNELTKKWRGSILNCAGTQFNEKMNKEAKMEVLIQLVMVLITVQVSETLTDRDILRLSNGIILRYDQWYV